MNNTKNMDRNYQYTFPKMLTVLFIGLKLTNHIDWSWLWIISPLWIAFGLAFICRFIELLKNE